MASFPPYTRAEIRSAVARRRLVMVVGQRRSGLTHWATAQLSQQLGGRVRFLDFAQMPQAVVGLTGELKTKLGLPRVPETPGDLIPLVAELPAGETTTVLLTNTHCASPEAAAWFLKAILNPVVPGENLGAAFVAEGAIDVDDLLFETFPSGLPDAPLVLHADSSAPWHTMVEVEALLSGRARQFPPVLTAFLADVSGGDVGFVNELLERLPGQEWLDQGAFLDACEYVQTRGVTATQIRTAALALSEAERELAAKLVAGEVIWGRPPSTETRAELRHLYLHGLAIHDPVVRGYRIRSPLVGKVVRAALKLEQVSVAVESGHSVTNYLIWQIANFEKTLRSVVANTDCVAVARNVSTVTPWSGRAKLISAAAARTRIAEANLLGELTTVLREVLPDQQGVLDAVSGRLRLDDAPTAAQLVDGVTFDELAAIAGKAGVLKTDRKQLVERIRTVRNAVAHFRSVTLEHASEMSAAMRATLKSVLSRG